jgi:hypothetical protein
VTGGSRGDRSTDGSRGGVCQARACQRRQRACAATVASRCRRAVCKHRSGSSALFGARTLTCTCVTYTRTLTCTVPSQATAGPCAVATARHPTARARRYGPARSVRVLPPVAAGTRHVTRHGRRVTTSQRPQARRSIASTSPRGTARQRDARLLPAPRPPRPQRRAHRPHGDVQRPAYSVQSSPVQPFRTSRP